jgi:oxygen-dependent protoporphyrinogen oxidase
VTDVVVIGAGIAGLAAAYELSGGASGPTSASPSVTVFDCDAVGGALSTGKLDGRVVDLGPDGFLARRPEATALVGELGGDALLEPVGGQGAWVVSRGKLRKLPTGLALGIPTRLRDLRTSETIGLLGMLGSLRASIDLIAPRKPSRPPLPDRAIGPLVADKLGARVVRVLVDPLIGGIHAGRVRDLSAAAVFPPVLAAGQGRGSMMRALRTTADASRDASGPAFYSLRDGLGSLPSLLADVLRERGVQVTEHVGVTGLRRGAPGAAHWTLDAGSASVSADAVVLATPPVVTARLMESLDANAASFLQGIDAASVVVVVLQFGDDITLPAGGTGVLVPSGTKGPGGALLTSAITFLDRKWPHLAREGTPLLRVSAGRIDDLRALELADDDLVATLTTELGALLGIDAPVSASLVARWPNSLPQYRVNHLLRVQGIEAAAGRLGGLAVAGAAYRGVGVPACIASGRGAARAVRSWLSDQS